MALSDRGGMWGVVVVVVVVVVVAACITQYTLLCGNEGGKSVFTENYYSAGSSTLRVVVGREAREYNVKNVQVLGSVK